jgi:hypothetical protein
VPRYYFHIHGPNGTIPDDEGSDLPEVDAARKEALLAVREMVADTIKRGANPSDGRQLWVADESGKVLFAIPFRQVWRR